jgi:tRNA pseudouridine38-40 synthase
MARYKLILAYDGTAFAGSQRQAKRRTVQGELEKALCGLGWAGRSVTLAGRTDTGVHASGQVAAFDLEWRHGLGSLLRALNAGLPADMAASSLELAGEKFHPRFDATSRRYRYRLYCGQVRDPLRERMAWRVWPSISGDNLFDLARSFSGQHDFAAFGSSPSAEGSTVRTVKLSEWKRLSRDEWQFEVQADAFLYHMVRRLVFVQVAVGQGRCDKGAVVKALERLQSKNGLPAGLAPARGLTLVKVTY